VLLDRSPRGVKLTHDGETLLAYALRILALNDELVARVNEPQLAGHVRLGTPEDFATSYLPGVLAEFAQSYPLVTLEVRCDLTRHLTDRFHAGEFDLVLVKREPQARSSGGVRVWREPLVWVAAAGFSPAGRDALPLVVSPEPCVYRKRATEALDRARRPWRVSYTCASLAGAQAAVRAGLGLTVLPKDMTPDGLVIVEAGGLPNLHDTEIALLTAPPLSKPADRLREHIVRSLERRT
jgi:DNA-binding transcriptional LysR family regulator